MVEKEMAASASWFPPLPTRSCPTQMWTGAEAGEASTFIHTTVLQLKIFKRRVPIGADRDPANIHPSSIFSDN
jgi:hypothetical protein